MPDTQKIFIDTKTGTWGMAEDIVFVDALDWEVEALDISSDSEIIAYGNGFGDAPILSSDF